MSLSYNIGFIGGGNMSTAIAKGILRNETHPASKIWVSGPRLHNLKSWEEMGANITTKNGEAIKVLSKDSSVVRIMPNTPMSVGAGVCLYTPDNSVTREQCEILEKLLSSCGIYEEVSEPLMDAAGALPGCGPAFMYVVIEALADGAVKQGVPRAMALRLAAQVLIGSGQMVLQTNKHPGLLKDEVCSPGGTTICGVTALENGRLRATLINAIEAARLRSKELGKK